MLYSNHQDKFELTSSLTLHAPLLCSWVLRSLPVAFVLQQLPLFADHHGQCLHSSNLMKNRCTAYHHNHRGTLPRHTLRRLDFGPVVCSTRRVYTPNYFAVFLPVPE